MNSLLKAIRLAHGLPIVAVAVRARVGPGTIIAVEKHGHVPTLQTKHKIASALGVEPAAIWPKDRGDGHSPPTAA